ncbi:MAG: menaquinone biosynthesis protein [Candidatus Latescibacteria bacterium]|nr:menaquinone biosynthesis protein [Candidatus Latescibacterota bacterium]
MKPRLGAVPYLNTRPLVVALECNPAPFALSYSVPSRCARELADGTIDVGIIPAIEYARSARPYWIVPNIAIGSQGPVLTVRLFCRRPLPQVERIALDTSSRTSVALLSILLREKFAFTPQLIEAPPDLEDMLECADAALLIGDQVFPHLDGELDSLDLGQEWTAMTDLPFVFAFWAGRQQALTPAQVQQLQRAKDQGVCQVPSIAAAHSREFYERYLTHHIRFDLDEAAQAGLRLFYQLAHRHGLIDAVPLLRFYPAA